MLSISENKRYIQKDGVFFPYLADTAWTLLQKLSREEIVYYLDMRKSQGFNAVQVSYISELDGVNMPNREGQLPFHNGNVLTPNKKYAQLFDFLATECKKRDIVITLLPTWGDKFNKKWGIGPEIFTPDNAFKYGCYIAGVVGDYENVIFMLGGDRPIESENHRIIIDEMASGIRCGEKVRHLITYHPCGEKSSVDYLPDTEYIDFHSIQSSHAFGGFSCEKMIARTLKFEKKPCFDAECAYEDIPLELDDGWGYRFNDGDIRRRIYKNMLSGAFGHTYGHAEVWCFNTETGNGKFGWKQALTRPMANQMRYVNELLKILDIKRFRPAKLCKDALCACSDSGDIAVYLQDLEPVFMKLKTEPGAGKMIYFNPKTGKAITDSRFIKTKTVLKSPFDNDAIMIFLKTT
ncbi:MAG: DUF4038 domain-containing protein [Clostridia bacterium]|nr:DUF4038 domain-containing protein [Clostridia bacterium]